MNGKGKALDNPLNWSFGIGRLFDIRLRVHVLFVLGAIVILARSLGQGGGLTQSVVMLGLLFLIVLIHEFGHCFGSRHVGGEATEILMWPLGGLASVAPPHRWRAHLVTAVAGPAVNVAFCVLTAAVLTAWTGSLAAVPWNPFALFTPLSYEVFNYWTIQQWLVVFFGLNFMLLLFNLLPVFPLDGGRVLQCLLWPKMGYARSMLFALGLGMVGAIAIAVVGFLTETTILFFIAVFGYVTCWMERQQLKMSGEMEAGQFGYDFSQGYTSLDNSEPSGPKEPGYFERKRQQREARRREKERIEARQRDQRLDALLTKVRENGLGSLSGAERKFLEQETRRRQQAEKGGI